jgi:hypothetical protein
LLDCSPAEESFESSVAFVRQALVVDALASVVNHARSAIDLGAGGCDASQELLVHAPLSTVRGAAFRGSHASAIKVLERSAVESKSEEDEAASGSSKVTTTPGVSLLWRGLRALQSALRQHLLPRFPVVACDGSLAEAAALRLNIAIASLSVALLPTPLVVLGAASGNDQSARSASKIRADESPVIVSSHLVHPAAASTSGTSTSRKRQRTAAGSLSASHDGSDRLAMSSTGLFNTSQPKTAISVDMEELDDALDSPSLFESPTGRHRCVPHQISFVEDAASTCSVSSSLAN